MPLGADRPGRITRIPGGVAMNIAMTLRQFGMDSILLSAVGTDEEGQTLIARAQEIGVNCDAIYRPDDLPTDVYMAIEGANGLIAAIADAHSLEAAGDRILTPLSDGRLGSAEAPYHGIIALDGNLTTTLLEQIALSPIFGRADLRVAPASPGKATRLLALINHKAATFYVNLEEAGLICKTEFEDTSSAAAALVARGVPRALVTDGANPAADAARTGVIAASPPIVEIKRVTGAGDTFMAAHIAAEAQGATPQTALDSALRAAATYVSGETPK